MFQAIEDLIKKTAFLKKPMSTEEWKNVPKLREEAFEKFFV